tara:strand:+ start:4187 stop:5230 length:1044 start_codon:yes stop_codon:yes gene_type:complete
MDQKQFFHIDLENLTAYQESTFSFHIYVFHPINKNYTLFLHANSPLTMEKYSFLEFITEKGGKVSISQTQKKTFLQSLDLKEEDIPELQEPVEHELIGLAKQRQQQWEKEKAQRPKFHFKEALASACAQNDWSAMIEETRQEAMAFSFTLSHTVSLANFLAENLLIEDNHTNRIVALSFQLAKGCGMDDPQALGDLICASYFAHIGHTQMDLLYTQKPQLELNTSQRNEYKKHPGLAQHLIKKSGVLISERCNKILYQHHERYNGSGYPEYKQGPYIEPLALVLGASAHILEYMSGKITGSPIALTTVLRNLKEKTLSPGLELDFGDTIYESLIYLLDDNQNEKKVA